MTVQQARWYPDVPPGLPGETPEEYTDRLTGTDGTGRSPYDHRRHRQCALGYHLSCSANGGRGGDCGCPHHDEPLFGGPMSSGANLLAGLYHLPDGTADNVMRIAANASAGAPDPRMAHAAVATAISSAYDSPVSEYFVIDVLSLLQAAGAPALEGRS